MSHSRFVKFSLLIFLAALAACSATTEPATPPAAPAGQAVTVQVTPPSAALAANGSAQFAAAVTGTANTAVAWTVVESGGGTVSGSGLYTAPGSAGTFHVRATSAANAAMHGDATVVVSVPTPVTVTLSPSPASVDACQTVTFAATVANATNTAVTWSVQEGASGGTIAANGVYTAPAAAGVYHVVATSVADPSKTAVATVTVSDRIVSVTVNPPTASSLPGGTVQFTATVTTTCGSFVASAP